MPNFQNQEVTRETIESPFRISWPRLGRTVLPPLIIIFILSIWFVYFFIPSKIDKQNQNIFVPETKIATSSAGKSEKIEISEVIANPKKYDSKKICITSYYFQGFETSALLDTYSVSEKKIGKISTWVINETGENIIDSESTSEYVRKIEACGLFETGEGYGHLSSYQNQLTMKKFTLKGESIELNSP